MRNDPFAPRPPSSSLLASICRHGPDDPNCGSHPSNRYRAAEEQLRRREKELEDRTPDPDRFEVDEVEQVGRHLVLKVKYPSCANCAYEGSKVMVFLDVDLKAVIKWKRIDPHFRDGATGAHPDKHAPSPAARFPASKEGLADALEYARSKSK